MFLAKLISRVVLCLGVAAPALVVRFGGWQLPYALEAVIFGAAIVAAAFLLAWAAEAAHKDISGVLAIAILALIAVLPEYAVDLYYAFRSGTEHSYQAFAAANMTGSNRLLLGFGWPLVVAVSIFALWRRSRGSVRSVPNYVYLPPQTRVDIGFLIYLGLIAAVVPLVGSIPLWFGIVLITIFILYLWRAGQSAVDEDHEFAGTALTIAGLPTRVRRIVICALFAAAAIIILLSAGTFADALVGAGTSLGVDSFLLVQWVAPLASEAPEFLVAAMFAARGMGSMALATLIAAKVNQWSLLVGSLPVAHILGGGSTALTLDARQIEEFVLTATQTLLGVALIISLRLGWKSALLLLGLFALQFAITDPAGRYLLSAIQLAVAIGVFVVHRRQLAPTLAAPFRLPAPVEQPVPLPLAR